MDIVRIIKSFHVKANFQTLALKHKFFFFLFLLSLINFLIPHEVYAATATTRSSEPALVFNTDSYDYQDYLTAIEQQIADQYYQQQMQAQVMREQKLANKVQGYLAANGSPLAAYASTLITLRNWKKIVALSNAESSMCLHYPVTTANCWGVGGSNLWDLGANLGQGIIAMNHFLNTYPKGSVKYSQMTFNQMNGLYKQPPAQHWVNNNQTVYNDLMAIESSL